MQVIQILLKNQIPWILSYSMATSWTRFLSLWLSLLTSWVKTLLFLVTTWLQVCSQFTKLDKYFLKRSFFLLQYKINLRTTIFFSTLKDRPNLKRDGFKMWNGNTFGAFPAFSALTFSPCSVTLSNSWSGLRDFKSQFRLSAILPDFKGPVYLQLN